MQNVVHTIQSIARHEVLKRSHAQMALVSSVHGSNGQPDYACTVKLRETGLVLPKVPIATSVIGHVGLPVENDLVIVLFMNGDLHAPVVVGRLYSEQVDPPAHQPGEVVIALPGHEPDPDRQLLITATTPDDGSRQLNISLGGDVEVEVAISDDGVMLRTPDASLSIRQAGSTDARIEMKAGDARVTLSQSGDLSVEASGKLTLKAREIDIAAEVQVKVAGQIVELN